MFEDKSITPAGLVALIGAHTMSRQRDVQPERAGDPQDSTPGVWDTLYYRETTSSDTPKRVLKLQSDVNLANDARTRGTWQSFSGAFTGQINWNRVSRDVFLSLPLGLPSAVQLDGVTDAFSS